MRWTVKERKKKRKRKRNERGRRGGTVSCGLTWHLKLKV